MMDKIKHHEGKKRRRRDFSDKKKIIVIFCYGLEGKISKEIENI